MHELTKKATRDAATVKVLTILTLIYLPATVISVGLPSSRATSAKAPQNFFSTSFVNSTTKPDGSSFLVVASNWWILLATALPLTVVTIYAWKFYVQREIDGQYPAWWQVVQQACKRMVMITLRTRRRTNDILND